MIEVHPDQVQVEDLFTGVPTRRNKNAPTGEMVVAVVAGVVAAIGLWCGLESVAGLPRWGVSVAAGAGMGVLVAGRRWTEVAWLAGLLVAGCVHVALMMAGVVLWIVSKPKF